jgi:hypothetical protein
MNLEKMNVVELSALEVNKYNGGGRLAYYLGCVIGALGAAYMNAAESTRCGGRIY